MAERYGHELADALPEASAVLGFDDYPAIAARLDAIVRGERPAAHTPRDRRTLLPISPAERAARPPSPRPATASAATLPLPAGPGPRTLRRRLSGGPVAALKLASGCDRRCAFCAIPSFRGAFVSRPPEDILAEAEVLAADGVRELVLVSENSTAYGKDLGDVRLLEQLLPALAAVSGVLRVRVVYLQPAEVRPGLLETILTTPGVAPYLDLSFQHASAERAAPDAPLRRRRALPRAARRRPPLRSPSSARAATSSSASRARPAPTSQRAHPLPGSGPARCGRRLRLQRRGRHRGGRPSRQGAARPRSAAGCPSWSISPSSSPPTARRNGSAASSRCSSRRSTPLPAWPRAGRRTRRRRSTARARCAGLPASALRRVGDLVRAEVVASNGVDLVTELAAVLVAAGRRAVTGGELTVESQATPAPTSPTPAARRRPAGRSAAHAGAEAAARIQQRLQAVPAIPDPAGDARVRRRRVEPRQRAHRLPDRAGAVLRGLPLRRHRPRDRLAHRGLGGVSRPRRSPTGSTARSPAPAGW